MTRDDHLFSQDAHSDTIMNFRKDIFKYPYSYNFNALNISGT